LTLKRYFWLFWCFFRLYGTDVIALSDDIRKKASKNRNTDVIPSRDDIRTPLKRSTDVIALSDDIRKLNKKRAAPPGTALFFSIG